MILEIILLFSWPLLIVFSYASVNYFIKKLNIEE